MRARGIACTAKNTAQVVAFDLPDTLEPHEVLIERAYSAISPGTDRRCLDLREPGTNGQAPFLMGYSSVGTIKAAGADVTLPVETRVFGGGSHHVDLPTCWGAYTSHAVIPAEGLVVIPEGVDLLHASIAKLAAISYGGLRLARPQPHETVAIIGLGVIGQFAARLFHLAGCRVVAASRQTHHRSAAQACGINTVDSSNQSLAQAFKPHFPTGADIVVDCTGAPAVLQESVKLLADLPWDESHKAGPRLVIQGSYASDFTLNYQDLFLREASILVPRFSRNYDLTAIFNLLNQGRLHVDDLVANVHPAEHCQAVYDDLANPNTHPSLAVFKW
ncbi:MAG: zinc-binding alcohol dehydrogenase [Algisphaera sp.]